MRDVVEAMAAEVRAVPTHPETRNSVIRRLREYEVKFRWLRADEDAFRLGQLLAALDPGTAQPVDPQETD